jgi:hypothetical protein
MRHSSSPEVEMLVTQLERSCVRMRGALLVLPLSLAAWGALQFVLNIDDGWRKPLALQWWDAALCALSIAGCALMNWRFAVAYREEEQGRALSRLLKLAEDDPGPLLNALPRLRRLARGSNRRLARQVLSQVEQARVASRELPIAHRAGDPGQDHLPRVS